MGHILKRAKLIIPAGAVAAIVAVTAVISSSGAAPTHKAASSAKGTVIGVKHEGSLGPVLYAGPKRLSVYMWDGDGDHASTSMCTGACAKQWPPVTTKGKPTVASGAKSADLGTIKRAGGLEQVTYAGHPLYFYDDDKTSATALGQLSKAFGAEWYVLAPSGQEIDKKVSASNTKPPAKQPAEEVPAKEEAPPAEEAPAAGGGGWG